MLDHLTLKNFRGFKEHRLPLATLTVMVGQNNAGKTTIVEALRLLSIVTLRYKNLPFKPAPKDTDLPRRLTGVSPSLKNVEINFTTIFYHYAEPPGILTATFKNGSSVTIYVLPENRIHAVIRNKSGKIIGSRKEAAELDLPQVHIMPQVAPLQRKETILSDDYVKATMSSRLAPLHFRNQLRVRYDLYPEFRRVVEETWPKVQVREFIGRNRLPREQLHLEIRNDDFVAEVAEMGHGLQMWLQTMWFLTLAGTSPTVILDEPDVYMHADLQRRIIRYLRDKHRQTIVTTHSVEIMSEVQPDEILVVDKKRNESYFAGTIPVVQAAIDRYGSAHNLHLTKLLEANRMILVEGKDLKLLKEFQDTLFPHSKVPFQSLPNMSIGGWGGWKLALGSSMGFHNALGQHISTYCLLDSDYHSEEEIISRYDEAASKDVQLHIWLQKEIENYLLSPSVIARFIAQRVAKRTTPPAIIEVERQLVLLADSLEDSIFDAIASDYWSSNRSKGQPGANRAARHRIKITRENFGNLTTLASGKQLLSLLSEWSNNEFGVSFSSANIAREMRAGEIDPEVKNMRGIHLTQAEPIYGGDRAGQPTVYRGVLPSACVKWIPHKNIIRSVEEGIPFVTTQVHATCELSSLEL